MKIIVIEDDLVISSNLKILLEDKGYLVSTFDKGESGLEAIRVNEYDVIILDWMLPDLNGDQVCEKIRDMGIKTPIIFLTAKNQIDDKVQGLDLGADDYITKPFITEELLARIRSVIRRKYNSNLKSIIELGRLKIDSAKCEVSVDNTTINFSPKLYNIIEYLAANLDSVVSRADIIEHLWDENTDIFSNVVDVHIKNIRKELAVYDLEKVIQTIKGKGYMLCSKTSLQS